MTVLAMQTSSLPINIEFPRVGEPFIGGELKSCAEDFEVVEELEFEPSGTGEHVYLKIRKTQLNTAWVGQQLASFCGIRDFDVGFAGRKDKFAVTTQWFSCYFPGKETDWDKFSLHGAEILSITRHSKKLRKGQLTANHFRIRIKNIKYLGDRLERCSSNESSLEDILGQTLTDISKTGFPNYFGEQRFGFSGNNIEKAQEYFVLCEQRQTLDPAAKRLQKKLRRKKDIYISAARSWLFNTWLADKVTAGLWSSIPENMGPLYGDGSDSSVYGLSAGTDIFATLCAGLDQLRMKEAQRAAAAYPGNLEWKLVRENITEDSLELEEKDTNKIEHLLQQKPNSSLSLLLEFDLPKGTYATSMLREFIAYTNVSNNNSPMDMGARNE